MVTMRLVRRPRPCGMSTTGPGIARRALRRLVLPTELAIIAQISAMPKRAETAHTSKIFRPAAAMTVLRQRTRPAALWSSDRIRPILVPVWLLSASGSPALRRTHSTGPVHSSASPVIGTNRTGTTVCCSVVPSSFFSISSSSWNRSPTGMTIRPPGANWSTSGCGT